MKQTDSGIWVPDTPTIFVKPTEEIISQRKMEGMQKLSEIKQWGLRNPTKFMERFIGVDLLDVQTYTFMNSWDKMYALWLCTRNYGKSTLLALYYMTRGMLLNNCRCYICAGTSDQSIETFEKIVSIAKNEIESFTGLTDVFRNEVVINMTNNDGFIRNPAGFTYRLYNGSFVKTLNSNVNAKRGKRAEAVCFDESGFLDEEVFQVIEPYTAQDKNFKMGGSVNVTTLPKELPNQLLYTSSASTTDSYFYKKYKEYSKAMIWGSKDHFVADINCEIMFNATYRGKIYPASLLTKEKVDNAMRENKEKALREYYNIFTSDGGADAIFKRSMIVKNSTIRPPIMFNDTKDRLFALAYDPARSMDNSFVLVGEYYKDSSDNWRMRIANGINFMDLSKKNKTPMRTPEQVKKLKQLILDYNGDGVDDYTNISNIFIDAGSGGAGVNIADYLMSDEELEAKFAELFEGTEDPNEPVKEPVTDPEADPESNDNSEFSNKKRYTKKENGNTEVTFEISHEDVRGALYTLLSTWEENDNEWYFINATYDDHFVYSNWDESKIFRQGYTKDGDAVSLSDERTELFKEYLTLSEKSELEELRSNYAALQNRINEYESKDKEAVLGAEIYTELKNREDFKELIKNQAIYSVEEVQTRADAILGKYVKEKGTFNYQQKPSAIGFTEPKKAKKPYGSLFKD